MIRIGFEVDERFLSFCLQFKIMNVIILLGEKN